MGTEGGWLRRVGLVPDPQPVAQLRGQQHRSLQVDTRQNNCALSYSVSDLWATRVMELIHSFIDSFSMYSSVLPPSVLG